MSGLRWANQHRTQEASCLLAVQRCRKRSVGVVTLSSGDRAIYAQGSLRSGNCARHGFPMRYCANAVNVSGQGGSFVMRGDEEISERREDRDEPL